MPSPHSSNPSTLYHSPFTIRHSLSAIRSMRHIAIDASRATVPRPTGTENYARQITQRLVRAHPEVRWTLYFRDEPGDWLADAPQAERVVLPAPRLWSYLALAPAVARHRPDALWVPAHILPPTAPLLGIPSLVTVHDLGYEVFPDAHTAAHRRYLQLTTRYHARAATRLVTPSEATRRDLVAWYGADAARIEVVPNGVDLARFQPVHDAARRAEVRARYGTGERFLLFVGTIQPRKNLLRLIRAFAPLSAEFPDVRLVLAGAAGWLSDDIERAAAPLGDRLVRAGFVSHDDLPALLSAAEALAFPSLFEGFGLPVLEAMACGTPVLTSRTSSLPEVAGDAAILVDPSDEASIRDGLRLLLGQPALRDELRRRGLARAAPFTWDRSAAGIWALLEEMEEGKAKIKRQKAKGKNNDDRQITTVNRRGIEETHVTRDTRQAVEIENLKSEIENPRITLLGLPIDNLSWEETLGEIAAMVKRGTPHHLVTVNPEFLMAARQDADFMGVLRRADRVLPDGVGLLLAARLRGQRFHARITGSDLTPQLAAEAARRGWRLYLLGAAPGVADEAAHRLRALHTALEVIADGSDPAPDGPPALLARIRETAPEILLVAYGAPKQDLWIDRFGRQTGVPVQIGIGGALDFIAGVVPRAPVVWQRLGLEWLWRLKEEPWRWRRMLALPRFAALAAWEAVKR